MTSRSQIVRRRTVALGLLAVAAIVGSLVVTHGGGHREAAAQTTARHPHPLAAVESGLLPWRLPVAVSREVVLPGRGNHVVVLGGLRGSTSEAGVFSLDTRKGALRSIGSLGVGVHDAAASVVGGRDLVYGGGTPSTVGNVEAFPAGRSPRPANLPSPRSDASAVTIGKTTYIVGGYTGSSPDAAVLATTDGRTYRSVASLSVPVRYPAVAAIAGKLYVFGGEAITGHQAGRPSNAEQEVDPSTHSSQVVGHMPEPLQGSAAVELGGHVYLAGGETTQRQPTSRGVGNLQLAARSHTAGGPTLFTVSTIWAFDPDRRRLLPAGRLQVPVAHAGVTVLGKRAWIVGGESGGSQLADVQMITPNRSFGIAGAAGAGSPYFGGKLLIADRGNNRLLLLDAANRRIWKFPSRSAPHDRYGFYFPDDAFFVRHGHAIITNQEQDETIQIIGFPSGKVVWEFGHRHQPGSAPGYLHEPDDAYLLKNGQITVADAENCRVLVINPNHRIARQIGSPPACTHDPPTSVGTVNGDTPLANGDLLVSEIQGSWIEELTPRGRLVWSVQLPIAYPSDPQQLGADRYLLADYATPGQIDEFNRAGKLLYRYAVAGGPGMLDHPSLVERLPSGAFMVNDDYRHRMAAIDPQTKALVWEYGVPDHPGTIPGLLRVPDGFDLLMPHGKTPTHPATG